MIICADIQTDSFHINGTILLHRKYSSKVTTTVARRSMFPKYIRQLNIELKNRKDKETLYDSTFDLDDLFSLILCG